jgi:hypothetical protein
MIRRIKAAVIWSLFIAILLCGLGLGCGRKAPPKAPSKDQASTVNNPELCFGPLNISYSNFGFNPLCLFPSRDNLKPGFLKQKALLDLER